MRAAACLMIALCAGCPGSSTECVDDPDCSGGRVCARNGECLSAGEVRFVRVTWTIRGMPASDTTCAATPDFYLIFSGTEFNDTHGYQPVPCRAGVFTVDKLPRRFVSVELGVDGVFSDSLAFDANGNAAFDLAP